MRLLSTAVMMLMGKTMAAVTDYTDNGDSWTDGSVKIGRAHV